MYGGGHGVAMYWGGHAEACGILFYSILCDGCLCELGRVCEVRKRL